MAEYSDKSRKAYGFGDESNVCPVCGCKHFIVERQTRFRGGELVKKVVRKTCRNCGAEI